MAQSDPLQNNARPSSGLIDLGGVICWDDTIVALDGLTKYAQQTRTDSLDLHVHVTALNKSRGFKIADQDRLTSRQLPLHPLEGRVGLSLTGTGCALAQLTSSYFSSSVSESEAFRLEVEVGALSTIDQCSIRSISPCLSYQGPGQLSNMAVMELALPSGFQADRPSLYELVDGGTAANIKMFEEKGDQINIYFTSLGRSSVCFTIKISENLPVENRKGSLVKLYDYYRPEQNVLRFYSLVNNCSRSGLEQDRERGRPKRSSHLDGELEAPHCR
ncbi:hypothetical protein HUJ04_013457 [Dendroctonus ponderosae]|nr:hypothetical protein HUJ04_013457 [Dendroctonus ponderosae]